MGSTNFFDGKRLKQFITNGSMASDYTSDPIEVLPLDRIGVECFWTGTPTGILYIQSTIAGTNYDVLPSLPTVTSVSIVDGFVGTKAFQQFDLDVKAFSRIRVFYDATSGSGTMNGYYIAKGTF